MGIYERKQESEKTRKQELDQFHRESDKKKLDQEITFLIELLFSYFLVLFYKFPPLCILTWFEGVECRVVGVGEMIQTS